jgi:hypothetical protein
VAGFNRRTPKQGNHYQLSHKPIIGEYDVNALQITCSVRELPELVYGERPVRQINVSGYVSHGAIDLSAFGPIDYCLLVYQHGPGFALAGVKWRAFELPSRADALLRQGVAVYDDPLPPKPKH